MDAGSGRVLQGRFLAPGPVAWRNKRRVLRCNNFPAGEPGLLRGLRSPLNTFTDEETPEKQRT